MSFDRKLLACVSLATALAAVYLMRNASADLWGHLQYGQFLVANGGCTGPDPFAYTTEGLPWHDHEYLSQMAFWLAYSRGGAVGLILLKCAVGVLTMGLLCASVRLAGGDARVWAPVLMLTSVMLGRWMVFRPQVFTFLFFAFFVWVLFRHLLGKRAGLWALPAVMALWVNMHGGFLAGLGAVGLGMLLRAMQTYNREGWSPRALARATGPLALTLGACLLASLCNPLGWRLWPYLWTELSFTPNRQFIDEWQPIRLGAHAWSTLTLFLLVGAVLGAGLLATPRRVAGLTAWQWALSCLPLTLMAFGSIRHIPVCTLWAAPVLALLAGAAGEANRERPRGRLAWLGFTALAFVPAWMTFSAIAARPEAAISLEGPVLGQRSPWGAVAFLRANGLRGRVYSPLWWGSYLTWELYPDVLVAVDGRNVTLFPGAVVEANLAFYLSGRADLGVPLEPPADFLLVPGDAKVLERLRADRRWAELYADEGAVVLVRVAGHAELVRRARAGELRGPAGPAPRWFSDRKLEKFERAS
jgi:hypothetical protein